MAAPSASSNPPKTSTSDSLTFHDVVSSKLIEIVIVGVALIVSLVIAFFGGGSKSSTPTGNTGITGSTGTTGLTGGEIPNLVEDGFAFVRDSSELMGRNDSEFWRSRGIDANHVFPSPSSPSASATINMKGKTVILKRDMVIQSLNVEGGQLFLNGFSLCAQELIAIGAEIYAGTKPSKTKEPAPNENLVDSQNQKELQRKTIETIVKTLSKPTSHPKMDVLIVKTLVYDAETCIYTSAQKDLIFVTQSTNTPTLHASPVALNVLGESNVHRILL